MASLAKITEHQLREHRSLSPDDDCYFLLEYRPGDALIKDLKMKMDRRDKWEWPYKEWTIRQIAAELAAALPTLIDFPATTFIPIPPSRIRSNPLYDDRVLQVLRQACPFDADIRESIVCREDHIPAHESDEHERPAVSELLNNYLWQESAQPLRPNVVLFDDIITAGNHFTACKRFVLKQHPATGIVGLFIARRALPANNSK